MMTHKARMSVTMNNTDKCSGGCLYCCAAQNMSYCLNSNYTIQMLRHIDEMMYKQWKFSPDGIRNTLTEDERMMNASDWDIDLWGADPVTNFQCLKDLVDTIRTIAKDNNKRLHLSVSTNGLPFMRDDITEYFLNNDIGIQLSHDGLGQCIRTRDLDPLDIDNVRKLMRAGKLCSINCTLNFWNYSLFKNMNYFNSKLKEILPEVWNNTDKDKWMPIYRRLYIKLNHIYDGQYNVKALHPEYKIPLGDMSFHNDKDFPLPEFTRVLDNYIDEWFKIWRKDIAGQCNYLEYMPYMRYIRSQYSRGKDIRNGGNMCRQFQIGLITKGDHIDSTGRYCQCNLIDADSTVANPSNDRVSYCKECADCKYKNSGECNMCGSLLPRAECQYYYRWNQFLEITRYGCKSCRRK